MLMLSNTMLSKLLLMLSDANANAKQCKGKRRKKIQNSEEGEEERSGEKKNKKNQKQRKQLHDRGC